MTFKPVQAGSSATGGRDRKREPDSEAPIMRKAKLLIIDSDPKMIDLGRKLLGKTCDIPEGIPHVTSLEGAKTLVTKHKPDIVLSGKTIDAHPEAYYDLLADTKGRYPDTMFVLWSGGITGDEDREGARYKCDAIVERTDINGIRNAVLLLSAGKAASH